MPEKNHLKGAPDGSPPALTEIQSSMLLFRLIRATGRTAITGRFNERFDYWRKKTVYRALLKFYYFFAMTATPVLIYDKTRL